MHTLCIIPARSGSKGLPGKNLLPLGPTSLLGRCVQTAVAYTHQYPEHGATVLVSSDDADYLRIAHNYGAQHMVQRPAALASDEASSEVVMQHAWQSYGEPVDVLVLLQCTSPFTTPEDIAQCVSKIAPPSIYSSSLTVAPFDGFVWYPHGPRGWSEGATGSNHSPLLPRKRRQDRVGECYLETGGVYAIRAEAFRQTPHRFAPPIGLVEIERWRALEIDTDDDYRMAELLYDEYLAEGIRYATV